VSTNIETPSTALVLFDQPITPSTVFAPGGPEPLLARLRAAVFASPVDASTEAGRKGAKSMAYKLVCTKRPLENVAKTLSDQYYTQWKAITGEKSKLLAGIDKIKDDYLKPVTEYEAHQANRVADHEAHIAQIQNAMLFSGTSDELRRHIQSVEDTPTDREEFTDRAIAARTAALYALRSQLAGQIRAEEEAAELARLRAEEAERQRVSREKDAIDRAVKLAEARAAQEFETARIRAEEARKGDQDLREREARRREAALIAAADQAERDRQAAVESAQRAEQERESAIARERQRVADDAEKAAQEQARREADKEHRTDINRSAVADLVAHTGLDEGQARAVVTAIARKMIRCVVINY
jgi:hypothetical protein